MADFRSRTVEDCERGSGVCSRHLVDSDIGRDEAVLLPIPRREGLHHARLGYDSLCRAEDGAGRGALSGCHADGQGRRAHRDLRLARGRSGRGAGQALEDDASSPAPHRADKGPLHAGQSAGHPNRLGSSAGGGNHPSLLHWRLRSHAGAVLPRDGELAAEQLRRGGRPRDAPGERHFLR